MFQFVCFIPVRPLLLAILPTAAVLALPASARAQADAGALRVLVLDHSQAVAIGPRVLTAIPD